MKYLKKFNEEIGNPHHPNSFDRIEEFIKLADKIINYDESEYEQGEEPSNTDILSELGDLCNELTFTSEELQQVINSGRISDPNNFLQIILDETLRDEESYSMANGKKFKFEINKLFETLDSYRYIDKLGFQELDKVGLELIRDNFKNLQKEDVRDAFYELEDFGYSIQVLPFIWKGEPLERVNIRFDNDKFSILSTNKQGDGITWNSYPNLKLIHAEFLDDFSDNQINDIRNITSVTDYFKNDIQREINNFSNYLESGYFPCLGFDMRVYKEISKENLNPFWILRNDIKPIINDIRLRLESMGKELIFASKYLFIIVEKKYINPI